MPPAVRILRVTKGFRHRGGACSQHCLADARKCLDVRDAAVRRYQKGGSAPHLVPAMHAVSTTPGIELRTAGVLQKTLALAKLVLLLYRRASDFV